MPAPTLTTVTTGTITAAQHNEVTNFLQPSSGATVTGNIDFTFWGSGSGQFYGIWISLAQRTSVPASVSVTPSLPSGVSNGGTGSLSANGFKYYVQTTAGGNNFPVTGTYTVTY